MQGVCLLGCFRGSLCVQGYIISAPLSLHECFFLASAVPPIRSIKSKLKECGSISEKLQKLVSRLDALEYFETVCYIEKLNCGIQDMQGLSFEIHKMVCAPNVRKTLNIPMIECADMSTAIVASHSDDVIMAISEILKDFGQGRFISLGSKSCGKSTLNRFFLNKLLMENNKVAFLDLDPALSEMTEPGVLSLSILDFPLLGMGQLYRKRPFCSKFYGSLSPLTDPQLYCSLVQELMQLYSQLEMPLVINVGGFHVELIQNILEICSPTHTFCFNNVPLNIPKFQVDVVEYEERFKQSDLILFKTCLGLNQDLFPQSLVLDYPTYSLPLSNLEIEIRFAEITKKHQKRALLATLVGLMNNDEYLGLGVIRAFSETNVFLSTKTQKMNKIVRGDLELQKELMVWGLQASEMPYIK